MYQLVKGIAVGMVCLGLSGALAAPNAMKETASTFMSAATHRSPSGPARIIKYASESGELESLLFREDEGVRGERLTGLTRLADDTRLWEEARFDRGGRLVRAEFTCSYRSAVGLTVVFEPGAGVVETRTAEGFHRWSVPTDFSWVWSAHGCDDKGQTGSVSTPVAALVAARASVGQGMMRVIDTRAFSSHTVVLDQILVPEDAHAVWVVLGDDAVLVHEGLPIRWRANTLGFDVEQR
jgi:hypothetical protein